VACARANSSATYGRLARTNAFGISLFRHQKRAVRSEVIVAMLAETRRSLCLFIWTITVYRLGPLAMSRCIPCRSLLHLVSTGSTQIGGAVRF
jgi:hypothetical protein